MRCLLPLNMVRIRVIQRNQIHPDVAVMLCLNLQGLFATVGCHPTRSTEFDKHPGGPEAYLQELDTLVGAHLHGKGRVVAIGECGLGTSR
jgi:TatD DNase family protein